MNIFYKKETISHTGNLLLELAPLDMTKNSVMHFLNDDMIIFISLKEKYSHNKDISLFAIRRDSLYFHPMSDEIKNDFNMINVAVRTNGLSLSFASDKLKNNEHIVRTAIENKPYSIRYVSKRQKEKKEIALTVIYKDIYLITYCGDSIQLICNKDLSKENIQDLKYAIQRENFAQKLEKELPVVDNTKKKKMKI